MAFDGEGCLLHVSQHCNGEGVLFLCVGVEVGVATVLLLEEEGGFEVFVESGVGAVSRSEGLRHVAEGTFDRVCSKELIIMRRVS